MATPPAFGPLLRTEYLRDLTLDAACHPRGQAHLCAASGLVCEHGRAYVVADDEHHLAVFRDLTTPGVLHRIRSGDLPPHERARKRRKPDLEALLALPPAWTGDPLLLALGSGSRPNRCSGFALSLDRRGTPSARVHAFDLTALYRPLKAQLGGLNIEGAMAIGDRLVLLNRGGREGLPNAALNMPMAELLSALAGHAVSATKPHVQHFELGALEGVPLGFTDGAARPDGSWLFSAAAEHSADSVADGPCRGSVVGEVSSRGELVALRRLAGTAKLEGIALQPNGASICIVTDNDDPARSAQLLRATWPRTRD
jgi:hypothetical protein